MFSIKEKEEGMVGLKIHYYDRAGNEIFLGKGFTIVDGTPDVYEIAFDISAINQDVPIENIQVVNAFPQAFEDALVSATPQSLAPQETKILWTSDKMLAEQFESISPVNFWIELSGEDSVGTIYPDRAYSGDINFEKECPITSGSECTTCEIAKDIYNCDLQLISDCTDNLENNYIDEWWRVRDPSQSPFTRDTYCVTCEPPITCYLCEHLDWFYDTCGLVPQAVCTDDLWDYPDEYERWDSASQSCEGEPPSEKKGKGLLDLISGLNFMIFGGSPGSSISQVVSSGTEIRPPSGETWLITQITGQCCTPDLTIIHDEVTGRTLSSKSGRLNWNNIRLFLTNDFYLVATGGYDVAVIGERYDGEGISRLVGGEEFCPPIGETWLISHMTNTDDIIDKNTGITVGDIEDSSTSYGPHLRIFLDENLCLHSPTGVVSGVKV